MRRARLLIYDGDEAWIEMTRGHEFVKLDKPYECGMGTIRSVELDPQEVTLFECKIAEVENDPHLSS